MVRDVFVFGADLTQVSSFVTGFDVADGQSPFAVPAIVVQVHTGIWREENRPNGNWVQLILLPPSQLLGVVWVFCGVFCGCFVVVLWVFWGGFVGVL